MSKKADFDDIIANKFKGLKNGPAEGSMKVRINGLEKVFSTTKGSITESNISIYYKYEDIKINIFCKKEYGVEIPFSTDGDAALQFITPDSIRYPSEGGVTLYEGTEPNSYQGVFHAKIAEGSISLDEGVFDVVFLR
ncbi:hypothetical protein [Pseudomonas sp. GW456-12-1-14-TSB6]|uniref:hypothetical protein n=1 Tax=Pseudomonas sp. GW456-12-1-14-TSB6 TaxID=2751350 RepID=UPI000CD0155F|nr:hypothetical protein [Pseudomonas sp. GW456-12-1-14-TSB6]POA38327.1 hypothetical protein C1891_08365 [Pseudomonas sp. GW456-12-1-14-TSB6]